MCGFLVSSVELLVTSERKAVGRDHHNIWVWGNCDLQGRPMRKWNQRLKLLEVVKPLFNISSDKHVSSSQMPVVGGTTKTEVHGFYSCPPGDYSVRKKKKKTYSGFHFIFISFRLSFYFSLNKNLAKKKRSSFSKTLPTLQNLYVPHFKKFSQLFKSC